MFKTKESSKNMNRPLKNQSPDCKNKNRMPPTSSPVKQIKRFLTSIKNQSHDDNHSRKSSEQSQENSLYDAIDNQKRNEEHLRNRITDLEIENNELIVCVKEYEHLLERNKQLEEQMFLLLEELERKEDQKQRNPNFYEKSHSTEKQMTNTFVSANTIGTKLHFDSFDHDTFKSSQSKQYEKNMPQHEQVQRLTEQNEVLQEQNKKLMKEIDYLSIENSKLKSMVDVDIKGNLNQLESKFVNYVTSLEEKIVQLDSKKSSRVHVTEMVENQFSLKQLITPGNSSAENIHQSNIYQGNIHQSNIHQSNNAFHSNHHIKEQAWNNWDKSSKHSSKKDQKEISFEKVIQGKDTTTLKKNRSSALSLVNINLELVESENSYYEHAKKHNNFHHKEAYEFANDSTPREISYSYSREEPFEEIFVCIQKIHYCLETLNKEPERHSASRKQQFEMNYGKIYEELKIVLTKYFNEDLDFSKMNLKQRQTQAHQMRLKINDLNEEIISLNKQIKLQVEETMRRSERGTTRISDPPFQMNKYSESYLQNSYYQDLEDSYLTEYQETKKKLQNIIEIIQRFNSQYQYLLKNDQTHRVGPTSLSSERY